MLAKSIIAGTVLSLMAGGVVYFGTEVSADNAANFKVTEALKAKLSETAKLRTKDDSAEHPHGEKAKDIKTPAGKTISAKKPTVKIAVPKTEKTPKSKMTASKEIETASEEKTQKKWLDQYLKSDTPNTKTKTKTVTRKIQTTEVNSWEPTAKEQMEEMKLETETAKSYGSGNRSSKKDTGTFIVEGENVEIEVLTEDEIEEATEKGFRERLAQTENIWVEKSDSKKTERKMLHDIIKKDRALLKGKDKNGHEKHVEVKVIDSEDGKTTIETETIDMGDGKIMKIVKKTVKSKHDEDSHGENHKKMHIKVLTDEDGNGGLTAKDIKVLKLAKSDVGKVDLSSIGKVKVKKDISKTVDLIMAEAEKIEMSELRDRAYLDLVTYALEHCNYGTANTALDKIQQVELRDTARNRIAVAYAKDGQADKAFAVIEDIEVEALRDVMRLQVIEAMIAPDELPKDMQ